MFEKYKGQNVIIILQDNFRKFGKLISEDNFFLLIEFYNGKQQPISKADIKAIDYDMHVNNKDITLK